MPSEGDTFTILLIEKPLSLFFGSCFVIVVRSCFNQTELRKPEPVSRSSNMHAQKNDREVWLQLRKEAKGFFFFLIYIYI